MKIVFNTTPKQKLEYGDLLKMKGCDTVYLITRGIHADKAILVNLETSNSYVFANLDEVLECYDGECIHVPADNMEIKINL